MLLSLNFSSYLSVALLETCDLRFVVCKFLTYPVSPSRFPLTFFFFFFDLIYFFFYVM